MRGDCRAGAAARPPVASAQPDRRPPSARRCALAAGVQDRGGALSLDAYMKLPTEQYNELDPSMIESLGGSRFLLRVPRVSVRGSRIRAFDTFEERERR